MTHSVCGNSVTQEAKGQSLFIDSVLVAPGLSLGILTGFQGPALPPLLSGNTGTAVLSCQTGLDIGPHALRPSPIRKILHSSTVVGRGFLKAQTCSRSSCMHPCLSYSPFFIFSLAQQNHPKYDPTLGHTLHLVTCPKSPEILAFHFFLFLTAFLCVTAPGCPGTPFVGLNS